MRKINIIISTLVVLVASLTIFTSNAYASSISINISKHKAIPGQWLTIKGRLSSHKAQKIELVRTLYNGVLATKTSNKDGSYKFTFRMASMPKEGFKVRSGGTSSSTVYVTSVRQEVSLTGAPNHMIATLEPAMVRTIALQKRISGSSWKTIQKKKTNANGNVSFASTQGPVYRALALEKKDISATYSLPLVTNYPRLTTSRTALNEPSGKYKVQPDSGNAAATKHSWYPAAVTWDWIDGRGMDKWTNFSTGTGKSLLTYGGLWQMSGSANDKSPNFGSLSSTYKKDGFGNGNWEVRSRMVQKGSSYTPYTVRYSLVPAHSPNTGNVNDAIILAEYSGYGKNYRVGVVNKGEKTLKTIGGVSRNSTNWHAYGVQVTNSHITWFVNGKTVATLKHSRSFKGKLVPRLELISASGKRMTSTNLATDWIRYFKLKTGGNILAPSADRF